MARNRRRALGFGRFAEALAALALRLKGYRILCRDHRHATGEIDLIVQRGRLVAFVEVKARHDLATAADAIRPQQRQRIQRAAQAFLQTRPDLADHDVRFDAVLVKPWTWPRHMADAWRP